MFNLFIDIYLLIHFKNYKKADEITEIVTDAPTTKEVTTETTTPTTTPQPDTTKPKPTPTKPKNQNSYIAKPSDPVPNNKYVGSIKQRLEEKR